VIDDSKDSVRKPALDEDGLDCFAIEPLDEIDTADDAPVAVVAGVAPAAGVEAQVVAIGAGAADVWRQRMRDLGIVVAVVVLTATVLKFTSVTPPAESTNRGPAAPVDVPPPPATSPSTSASAQPVARPGIAPAPAIDPNVAVPIRPVDIARAVPSAKPAPRPSAPRAASPRIPEPDADVRSELPLSAANENPIVAAPADVRTEPPPETPRALAAPAVIVPPPSERSSIERLLEAYRDAYDRLDAPSAAVIWPRVDTRALNRAFSTLAEQDLLFDSCDLDIAGARANARCVGEIRYVRRVGDQAPRVRRMSWSFAFERVSDRWQIAQVTAD
jgi:hypothetical protein